MIRSALAFSLLVALLLVPSSAAAQVLTIADSVAEFSGTQGQDGWYYGYYRRSGDSGGYDPDTDFRQFTDFHSGDGLETAFWILDETRFFTAMDHDQQHGNASVSARDDVEHWSIRRYVAEAAGPATITGFTREDTAVGTGDDGTIAKILINGDEVFSRDIAPEDQIVNPYAVLADLAVGDLVDFVMLPGETDYFDCPFFTATITMVPEPGLVGLLAAGAMTLLGRRRR
jgi:hypothetical protein